MHVHSKHQWSEQQRRMYNIAIELISTKGYSAAEIISQVPTDERDPDMVRIVELAAEHVNNSEGNEW